MFDGPQVETYDGKVVSARVFVSGPLATLAAEVVPTEKYMHSLREGAADNYLDPLYQVRPYRQKLLSPLYARTTP